MLSLPIHRLRRLVKSEDGVTAMECCLIAVARVVAIVGLLPEIGTKLSAIVSGDNRLLQAPHLPAGARDILELFDQAHFFVPLHPPGRVVGRRRNRHWRAWPALPDGVPLTCPARYH